MDQKRKTMMKKGIMTIALMCLGAMNINAQVYAGDSWIQLPTTDLYDTGVMNMHLRALAETAARREAEFERYSNLAYEAFRKKQWSAVISNVNWALSTKYYNSEIFYMRGYAYESLGDYRRAKKDYKKAKKEGSYTAEQALIALKNKMKQGRR
ncbi:MAG: hypothetical protein IKZ48_05920 [Prevotella sp.]|nr:hypothetical protein [Prevotella sp.]